MYDDTRINNPPSLLYPGAMCRTTSGIKAHAVTGQSQSSRCCVWWWVWHPWCSSSSSWSLYSLPRGCTVSRTRTSAFANAGVCVWLRGEIVKICAVSYTICSVLRMCPVPVRLPSWQLKKCVEIKLWGKKRISKRKTLGEGVEQQGTVRKVYQIKYLLTVKIIFKSVMCMRLPHVGP